MGEEEKHLVVMDKERQKKGKWSNSIPPVGSKPEAPPNSGRKAVHAAAAAGAPTPPTARRYVPPRSRLAPSVPSQQPVPGAEMVRGDAVSSGDGSGSQLCRRACGAAASLALVAVGILSCLAPLYLHVGGTLVMLLGCLGLFLVVLGLVGLFLSFLGLGSSSHPAVVIPASAVKQPLLGGRRGSGRPGSTMTVVVE